MRLTWYGTAGFRFQTGGRIFLVDPYLSGGSAARPVSSVDSQDVAGGSEIYLSHGHFDHARDVPQIARRTGATVYCAEDVMRALCREGVDRVQVVVARDGDVYDHGAYRAECFDSSHVRFDLLLIMAILRRSLFALGSLLPALRELRKWPKGQVLAWRFTLVAESSRIVHHLGSAGCAEGELDRLREMGPPDVLMVPLQGHTHVCRIGAHVVERLRPRIVIPHHYDDFYPPISWPVEIGPFVKAVAAISPPPEVVQVPIGEEVEV